MAACVADRVRGKYYQCPLQGTRFVFNCSGQLILCDFVPRTRRTGCPRKTGTFERGVGGTRPSWGGGEGGNVKVRDTSRIGNFEKTFPPPAVRAQFG